MSHSLKYWSAYTPRLHFFYRERGLASPGAELFCGWRMVAMAARPRTSEKVLDEKCETNSGLIAKEQRREDIRHVVATISEL